LIAALERKRKKNEQIKVFKINNTNLKGYFALRAQYDTLLSYCLNAFLGCLAA